MKLEGNQSVIREWIGYTLFQSNPTNTKPLSYDPFGHLKQPISYNPRSK